MKKILITGENSYIGTSVENWLKASNDEYSIDTLDMRSDDWITYDFSGYDTVFHVAGIAHKKETKKNKQLYYKVNRDLAFEVAKHSKENNVEHFIFLSSISVYGLREGVITKDTPLNPMSAYGESKKQAEKLINELSDDSFKVAILRPPMIYGKGCKGNYPKLSKLAKMTPIFPSIDNQRSMLYIDNLSSLVKKIIEKQLIGLFLPQNNEYVCTSELVKQIGDITGHRLIFTKLFNPIIRLFFANNVIQKMFGNLVYEKKISIYNDVDYQIRTFRQSVEHTEV